MKFIPTRGMFIKSADEIDTALVNNTAINRGEEKAKKKSKLGGSY